jgi:hypothetical protein
MKPPNKMVTVVPIIAVFVFVLKKSKSKSMLLKIVITKKFVITKKIVYLIGG